MCINEDLSQLLKHLHGQRHRIKANRQLNHLRSHRRLYRSVAAPWILFWNVCVCVPVCACRNSHKFLLMGPRFLRVLSTPLPLSCLWCTWLIGVRSEGTSWYGPTAQSFSAGMSAQSPRLHKTDPDQSPSPWRARLLQRLQTWRD